MTRPWILDDFDGDSVSTGSDEPRISEAVLEEERLAAFDRGYKDGWDDASATLDAEQSRIDSEFAHNLQAMSFTYFEARAAMLAEMEPLLKGIVETVLPALLQEAVGATILERLQEATETAVGIAAEIVVAPGNRDRLESLLAGKVAPPLRIGEEPSLGEGQAFLKLGAAEEKIDLNVILTEIQAAVEEFFNRSANDIEERTADAG